MVYCRITKVYYEEKYIFTVKEGLENVIDILQQFLIFNNMEKIESSSIELLKQHFIEESNISKNHCRGSNIYLYRNDYITKYPKTEITYKKLIKRS